MKQSFMRSFVLVSLLSFGASTVAHAQQILSEEALFYRCFAQLTQTRVKESDPLLADVRGARKTAVQACTELLDRAKFTSAGGTKIGDESDGNAKAVLNAMYQLHRSWSREGTLVFAGEQGNQVWYEDRPIGAYFTRALFSPFVNADSILSGTEFLQASRATMDPPKSYGGIPSTTLNNERDWRLGANQPFAPIGDILGIREVKIDPIYFFDAVPIGNSLPDFSNIGVDPVAVQAVPNINFADVTAVKGPLSVTTAFAIRYQGAITIPADGLYSFSLSVDDTGQVLIDGERAFTPGQTTPMTLTAGSHVIEVQYLQRTGAARLVLNWTRPGQSSQVVPATAFTGLSASYYVSTRPPPLLLTGSEGGGFIGSHNYLQTSYNQPNMSFVPDGQLGTDRSYARAVLRDVLCREVPVVREEDVTQFVVPDSTTPFRQQGACTACHATLDRLAGGTVRGLRWNILQSIQQASPAPDLMGIAAVRMSAPSFGADTSWPATRDPFYAQRQQYGRLYFRNYKGDLIDKPVRSIAELGSVLLQQDDFFACVAKRYYEYFTGISVDLGDPGDPAYQPPNATGAYHRSFVISLGEKFKTTRSLRQVILDILASEQYRMTDLGIAYGGPKQ